MRIYYVNYYQADSKQVVNFKWWIQAVHDAEELMHTHRSFDHSASQRRHCPEDSCRYFLHVLANFHNSVPVRFGTNLF